MLDKLDATTLALLKTRVAERLVKVLNGPSKYSMDGKVYGCRHVDSVDDYVYIGSTCETSVSRFNQHCYLASRGSDALFHQHMMEHGGPEKFICDIIRYVPCKCFKELLKAEEVAIRHFRPVCNINHNDNQARTSAKGSAVPDHNDDQTRTSAKGKAVPRFAFEAVPDIDDLATLSFGKGKSRTFVRSCVWKRTVKLILADVAHIERDDKVLYESLNKAGKHLGWLVNFLIHRGRADCVSLLCDAKFHGSGKITLSRGASILNDINDLAQALGFRHCYDQVQTVDTATIMASESKLSGMITEIRKRYDLPHSSIDTYRALIMGIQYIFLALVGVKLVNVRTKPVERSGKRIVRMNNYKIAPVDVCMSMLISNASQD